MEGGGGWRRGGKEWESFVCWMRLEGERGAGGGGWGGQRRKRRDLIHTRLQRIRSGFLKKWRVYVKTPLRVCDKAEKHHQALALTAVCTRVL